jgi:DNA-binding NarL/FixJ family response regulator
MVWSHRVLGEAVAASLRGRAGLVVAGVSGGAKEALRHLAAERADVVLVDASVNAAAALELTVRLQDELPRLRVLPFGVPSPDAAVALIEAGAIGCLPNDASLGELAEAILGSRHAGHPTSLVLAAKVAARIEELSARVAAPPSAPATDPLSEREAEVLVLMARGLGNKEIAVRLDIRTATVKNHVHSILVKLGARGRREAVRMAYERRILRGPLRWRTLDEDE